MPNPRKMERRGIPGNQFERLAIFVPASDALFRHTIAPKSGIVGDLASGDTERILVYYEGAIYGQAGLKTYADRTRHAAFRLLENAPTSSYLSPRRSELRQVGWLDMSAGVTLLDDPVAKDALASWLGVKEIDPQELRFSHR